jgi:carbon storage regulator
MLVLSRKSNESILIDSDIRITVLGIRGNQVRLGIEAPNHVKLMRAELVEPAATEPTTVAEASESARPAHRSRLAQAVPRSVQA